MASFYRAFSVDVEEDLLPLSALLHKRGVSHRIFEEGGRQVLEVAQAEQTADVRELYRAWREGEVKIELQPRRQPVEAAGPGAWHRSPITMLLITGSIIGFLLVSVAALNPLVAHLLFAAPNPSGTGAIDPLSTGQYWRLITPVFLHFSWLHIVFNCLWMWELGSRVEYAVGKLNTLLLFLVIALISNVCQARFGGGVLFGGMSGVIYGLLGFAWVAPLMQPRWLIQPRKSIMVLMVGWLIFCATGFIEQLGLGAIANWAHFSGLISGAVLGILLGLLSRLTGDSEKSAET